MAHAEDHGHSPANWAATVIGLVAFSLLAAGAVLPETWMWVSGLVLLVVAFAVWRLLQAAGKGDPKRYGPPMPREQR